MCSWKARKKETLLVSLSLFWPMSRLVPSGQLNSSRSCNKRAFH